MMNPKNVVLCVLVVLAAAAFRPQSTAPTIYVVTDTVAINAAGDWRADKALNCKTGDLAISWGYSIFNGEWGVLQAIPSAGGYQFRVANHDEFMPYEFTVRLYITCMKFQ